jgi:hypothetical protein
MDNADIDAEEDEHITHMAVVSQEVQPGTTRIKISAQTMNQKIFSILLACIAGVDAQPDTLDKGPYGPWYYLMELYAAEQLALYGATNQLTYTDPTSGRTVKIIIQCRKILEEAAKQGASSSSIPRALIEASLLHIIVRVYSPEHFVLIRLKFLAVAMGGELEFVKGNQQKNKIRDATSNELVTVKSKAPIWHLYFAPKVGTSLRGMAFPAYLKVLTHTGEFIELKYIVRPNSELMEGDQMIICEGPSGCKKYHLPNVASDLKVPRCICNIKLNTQAENLNKSKMARMSAAVLAKQHGTTTLHAMLGATKAGPCPRFLAGLCPNNKKGESCSGDHNTEGAWIETPEGKRACTIVCKLPPHSKL